MKINCLLLVERIMTDIPIDKERLRDLMLIEKHYKNIIEKCAKAKLENPYSDLSSKNLIDMVLKDLKSKNS